MAAPVAAAVLRELGVDVRQFKTIRGLMLWFSDYEARRGAVRSVSDFSTGGGKSREERERERSTWARIRLCLRESDPEIDNVHVHHAAHLLDWHRAWTPQGELAKDWGFPSLYALRQAMRFTESVLRGRFEARGLLPSEAE